MLLPSCTSTAPSGVRTETNPVPPIEPKKGSATHAIIAEARQASTALPPARATLAAARAPSSFPDAAASLGVPTEERLTGPHPKPQPDGA